MRVEIELSDRRLEKAGFSYEAAANTIKTAFRQRGARLIEDDISLIFEGKKESVESVIRSLKAKEWFSRGCVLCETNEE